MLTPASRPGSLTTVVSYFTFLNLLVLKGWLWGQVQSHVRAPSPDPGLEQGLRCGSPPFLPPRRLLTLPCNLRLHSVPAASLGKVSHVVTESGWNPSTWVCSQLPCSSASWPLLTRAGVTASRCPKRSAPPLCWDRKQPVFGELAQPLLTCLCT